MTDFVGGGWPASFPSLATLIDVGPVSGVLLRGCLTEKIAGKNRRTLSHEHTIFRDSIFPDACARTWWEIGGGKKTPGKKTDDWMIVPEALFQCLLGIRDRTGTGITT